MTSPLSPQSKRKLEMRLFDLNSVLHMFGREITHGGISSMDYQRFFTTFQEAHGLIQGDEISALEYHNLGNLVVTSGKLLACDPYYCTDTEPFTARLIPIGQYPVIVSVAHIHKTDQRVALSAILFRDTPTVNWE